jgi:two-component system, cell cycle sensor histidine kinase and response regulator CckA
MSSPPTSLSPSRAATRGVALALAFAALVGTALWAQWRESREVAASEARERAATQALMAASGVPAPLARLYVAGIHPSMVAETRQELFEEARSAFADAIKVIADAPPEAVAELRGAGERLAKEVQDSLQEKKLDTDQERALKQMSSLKERHGEAMQEHAKLLRALTNRLNQATAESNAASARSDRVELFVLAALIGVLGFATTSAWRLASRVSAAHESNQRLISRLRDSEAKYRSIFDNAVEGFFQTTPNGKFITANKAFARMHGYKSPEHLLATLSDIGTQLYVDPVQRSGLMKALSQSDAVSNFEFEVVRADGRTIWLRENVHAVRDESGALRYFEGTVEDVTSQWWSEQRRRLQYATARVLGESATIAEARPRILKTICEIVNWHLGAVWDIEPEAAVQQCVEIWHAPSINVDEFEQANSNTTQPLGVGFAGEVWRTGEPKWIANLSDEVGYENAAIAVKAGMGSAFGIPIKVRGEVRHVLEFFSPKATLPDPELLQTLGIISSQLGHLIERKVAEEALRSSELRKAAILHSALDGILSYEADGTITEFNPAAERILGRRMSDVLGRLVDEMILPESNRSRQRHALGLGPGAENIGLGRRFEIVAARGDGRDFPAEVALSRMLIDGRTFFTAYLRDMSERRAAEQVTSELAAVVANSNDAILVCTLDGLIRSWNAGAEQILGYTAGEAVGRPLHMLMPQERIDEFASTLTTVAHGQSLSNYETVRLRKDGKKINVSVTDSPIRGEGGTITGLSSIVRDITERRRLEEELLQSHKMEAVGRLAGGIAHDFNNVLTAILGYSDLLIGQIDDRHWMWKHLNEIRKAADFASSLTHQLLAFSRRQPLFPRVFEVNDSVRKVEKMLQRVIGEQIKVRTDLRAERGRVKADATQFEQVLLNLAVNARDAMPDGGSLIIATADVTYMIDDASSVPDMPAGEYVRLTVADSGVGISPDIVKHIFEPFFTTKETGQGTGLGLATCYGIVKQSGGYISVDTAVGAGSNFSIYLPLVDESGELAHSVKQVGALPGGNETILYVEDEITVRSLTAHVLRRLGYTVLEAGDGAQARGLCESHDARKIDLLLSDVVLPDLGGKELSEWLRDRANGVRVLFCSGYVDENILKRHGIELGTAFLQKPFSPADLARKVREVIDSTN